MLDITPNPQSKIQQNTQPENLKPAFRQPPQQKSPKNIFMETGEETSKLVGVFTIIAFIIILIVTGALYFLSSQKKSQLTTKQVKIEELKAQLLKPELKEIDERATRYSIGLKELSGFIASSPEYSILLKRLGELTPSEVNLTSFSVDNKNVAKISGKAVDNLAVSLFLKSLQEAPEFSDIMLDKNQLTSESSSNGAYYNFSISANLNTDTLLPKSQNPTTPSSTSLPTEKTPTTTSAPPTI